ncbi:MAG TPA: hypothetical protein VG096_18390 [Bryobacteraceae bacterium]|nr:hypothetical protein [Bryobacteraceae bacterium]
MKMTRREMAVALTSGVALASAVASAQTPAPPKSPEAELLSARDQVKSIAMILMQQQVPMSTEPAFVFQA